MRREPSRRQKGQVLPIAAIGFVVLCGIAGLAIDASRDYLAKRNAQNAADFATLAAAKQLTFQTSLSGPVSANSNPVKAAHDFAANNGFATNYNNACDSSTPTSFATIWFDVPGTPCAATSGFNNKVAIHSPPIDLPGAPVPANCQGAAQYACFQVVITTRVTELFAAVLGINTAYVTVGATAHATLPGTQFNLPPPNALVLYEPQTACNAATSQCFNEANPVARANLACTGTNNCPTYWTASGASTKIYGYDGTFTTPAGDLATVQSNGDMVIQARTTFCDPYNGAICTPNVVVGAAGFAIPTGTKVYCSKYGTGAVTSTPCTTAGQPAENELDASQAVFQTPSYWHASVNTAGLASCGGLVLNGGPVTGPCANAQEPYLIEPGIYTYIVINHGTYEFDQGLFDITSTAPVNTNAAAGYTANGIDHSKEVAGDFDLCTGGTPTSCPTLTAGVWIGHGGGSFSAYVPPANGACNGGFGSGSSGGGGDSTIISASGTVFRLESTSGGFVSTKEVTSLALSGAGVGALASVGGTPLLIDLENNGFVHLDAVASTKNGVQGIIYQTPSATAGGVEMNLGLTFGGKPAMTGQVLAYSYTSFGAGGTMDFRNGYGAGGVAGIQTSGNNETSIISSVTLTPAASPANFQTLTVNYTDEWMLDGYDVFLKINNGSPIFFSQGIWTTTPGPGAPLPPPNNNPSDTFPAYHSSAQPGTYTINPADPDDWTVAIPNSGGATFELKGSWAWGHQSDIPNANTDAYTAQALYTFPNPNGSYVAITIFMTDGDHCGDYALASYTFRNTGPPGGGTQSAGTVALVQ